MYNIPVLFLIFSRPDTTARVFERIREIKPAKLYVAADAPREGRPDEVKRCAKTRAIIDRIDWSCELKTLYRNKNLGCKMAVSEAISWFFEHEEYGVILEDDCLPDLSFFPFCEELLIKYKDDDRIGHIGGNCFCPDLLKDNLSYNFCSFSHIWGWASWRRVWKNYDVDFSFWEEAKKDKNKKRNLLRNTREILYFSSYISDAIYENRGMSTWDVQYLFMLRVQNQLSVYPAVNLVTNIGLNNPNATNTQKSGTKNCVPASVIPFPLKHPRYIMENRAINKYIMKHNFFSYGRILRYILNDY
ncbi:MAG: hypothetical protein LBV74_22655 [Tannerella sp.]|jgi:hypothetical protein|nr:hypothetical protein [Tannerella sp.]